MALHGYETLHEAAKLLALAVTQLQAEDEAAKKLSLDGQLGFYWPLKERHTELTTLVREVNKTVERYSKQVIPTSMDDAGVDMVRLPFLSRSFYPVTKHSASMVDKDAGMVWLRENGGEDLIQPAVNASSLASFLKELLMESGVEPPPEVMKLNIYRITGSSKYTPK